jgi:DNA-binding transcriptional MocR family regulator
VRFDAFRIGISRYLEPSRVLRGDALTFTATITLDNAATERVLVAACRKAGFGAMALSDFCDPALPSFGLVLGFGGANAARLETEAARLGLLLRAQAASVRSITGTDASEEIRAHSALAAE